MGGLLDSGLQPYCLSGRAPRSADSSPVNIPSSACLRELATIKAPFRQLVSLLPLTAKPQHISLTPLQYQVGQWEPSLSPCLSRVGALTTTKILGGLLFPNLAHSSSSRQSCLLSAFHPCQTRGVWDLILPRL